MIKILTKIHAAWPGRWLSGSRTMLCVMCLPLASFAAVTCTLHSTSASISNDCVTPSRLIPRKNLLTTNKGIPSRFFVIVRRLEK